MKLLSRLRKRKLARVATTNAAATRLDSKRTPRTPFLKAVVRGDKGWKSGKNPTLGMVARDGIEPLTASLFRAAYQIA